MQSRAGKGLVQVPLRNGRAASHIIVVGTVELSIIYFRQESDRATQVYDSVRRKHD
jgi:hypothetical protein